MTCDECNRLRHEYNAAVANGLIVKARAMRRVIDAHDRWHRASGGTE